MLMATTVVAPHRGLARIRSTHLPRRCATSSTRSSPSSRIPAPRSTTATPTRRTGREYSHNPYLYSPNIEAALGPDQKWNLDVWLANPDAWAMVTAGISSDSTAMPNFHCVLAVDGVVVKTAQGPKGALCSIRNW